MRTQFSKLALAASIVLALALTATTANAAVWNGTADTTWYTNHKTDTVFTITTAEQLAGLAKLVNGTTSKGRYNMSGKTIKLGANIMLNDTANWKNWESQPPANKWVPIGNGGRVENPFGGFNGIYDGAGHIVSGVYINSTDDYQGLFSFAYVQIENLGVKASYIKGNNYVGGLVGSTGTGVYTYITNSYSTGNVSGNDNVGGLVGGQASYITNSYSTGNVSGNDKVGGLAGGGRASCGSKEHSGGSVITNSYSTGNVSGNECVGGLAGTYNLNITLGSITNSYSTGNVSGIYSVGGLVGWMTSSMGDYTIIAKEYELRYGGIANSYSTGNVSGIHEVGGLVGYIVSHGIITNSYSIGNVSGDWAGGLVGYSGNGTIITNSYSIGNVSGLSRPYVGVGGLVGDNRGTINNAYFAGNVSGCYDDRYSTCFISGLVGMNNGILNNSYFTGKVEGGDIEAARLFYNGDDGRTSNVSGKTISEMQSMAFTELLNTVSGKIYATWKYNQGAYPTLLMPAAISPPLTLASKTSNSITINAIPPLNNGQIVEYTIGKDFLDRYYLNNVAYWQTSPTFTGLDEGRHYVIFARSKENGTYVAGPEIWLGLDTDKATTPISTPQIAANNISARATANAIILENLPRNATVEIYNLQGKQIYSTTNHSSLATDHLKIEVQTKGMYIIKVSFGSGTSAKILRATVTH